MSAPAAPAGSGGAEGGGEAGQGDANAKDLDAFIAGEDPGGVLGACSADAERKRVLEVSETLRAAKKPSRVVAE